MQGVYHFVIHHALPIFSVAKFEQSYTIYKQFSINGWAQSLLLSILSHTNQISFAQVRFCVAQDIWDRKFSYHL